MFLNGGCLLILSYLNNTLCVNLAYNLYNKYKTKVLCDTLLISEIIPSIGSN